MEILKVLATSVVAGAVVSFLVVASAHFLLPRLESLRQSSKHREVARA